MQELITFVVVLGVWLLMVFWILPKLGVST